MMTRTAELILQELELDKHDVEYRQGKGMKDGKEAITLLGHELIANEGFQSWVLSGFQAALYRGTDIAQVAVACNFIRLGYKVAMEELASGVKQ